MIMTDEIQGMARLNAALAELRATNSSNEKVALLSKYAGDAFVTEAVRAAMSPFRQYYVTSESCAKNPGLSAPAPHATAFGLLDDLHERSLTGHAAIAAVNAFVKSRPDASDFIACAIDKNLKIRMDASQINKAIPGCVPAFDVALAQEYEPKKMKAGTRYFASRKLDGVRCVITVDMSGKARCFSRTGNEFETLGNLAREIESFGICGVAFDGEVCLVDDDGNENFQDVMKLIRRKDYTIDRPMYMLFDMMPLADFEAGAGAVPFGLRYEQLRDAYAEAMSGARHVTLVEQTEVTSRDQVERLSEDATAAGWEGVMLRADAGYRARRTADLLKVKKFKDAEYEIVGACDGPMRVIRDGVEVTETLLSSVRIMHKGCAVDVGSGFSIDERRRWAGRHEDLIGKVITVKYFEETRNADGGFSLRFPTVKCVHGAERAT